MKRRILLLLSILLICTFTGCGKPADAPAPQSPVPQPAPEDTSHPEPSPLPQEPPPPTPEELAAAKVEEWLLSMPLEEKVGQLFFVRCPAENAREDVSAYHLGGYLLFGRDFKDTADNWLTQEQFTETIASYQDAALNDTGIPLLIGSDEEGGTVTRASRNPNLFEKKFLSPQALVQKGDDLDNIFAEDAREKSRALLALGINVNLAPVCDVSTNPNDFIYNRTLGQGAQATAAYVANTVTAMNTAGIGNVLKHFPGYGSNADTHTGIALDERPLETFEAEDFLPFSAGIAAGKTTSGGQTAAVLVSHNIVTCMDDTLPASLSPAVHEILREQLGFDGVIMTDDLAMDAVAAYAEDGAVAVMALQAGNDIVLTTDYRTQIPKVLAAVENGTLEEALINDACRRVLTWKQTLGLLDQ